MGVIGVDANSRRVTYHDACAGLRELGIKQQPRLCRAFAGSSSPSWRRRGVLRLRRHLLREVPDISTRMVDDKAADIAATGAQVVLAGDLGCLMNIAGRLCAWDRASRRATSPRCWPAPPQSRQSAAGKHRRAMEPTSLAFKDNARRAMADPVLQQALSLARSGFQEKRRLAAARLPEFEALRDQARAIKDHTLAHLDLYLEASSSG